MPKFVELPNLPLRPVELAIVDYRIPVTIKEDLVNNYGINLIFTPKSDRVYSAINGHGDIFVSHCGDRKVITSPDTYDYFFRYLSPFGFSIIKGKTDIQRNYPFNIAYNITRVGNYAIHNFKYTDDYIIKDLQSKSIELVNTKQGYSKCSIAIVSKEAIITSDRGIYSELLGKELDCLLIDPGHIELDGMEYGFIGGSCGLIDKNLMYFTGDITRHPQGKKIEEFLKKHGVKMAYVHGEPLVDVGTIIPLKEK